MTRRPVAPMPFARRSIQLACLATCIGGLSLLATGCGKNEYAPPPPPPVTVAQPLVQDVTRYAEFTGTTRAVESVAVRARVKGILESMNFEPGQQVEKGQPLFVIDPEPFQVALESAQAELESNKAERDLAKTEYDRTRTMYKQGATSELDLLRTRAQRDKTIAAVAFSDASVHSAQLDLDYAHVVAPISGRVGRHLVDVGNLVGNDGATHLADIVQYDPLYVYFYVSESDILSLQKRSRERREAEGLEYQNSQRGQVEVRKADEKGFPHRGVVDFAALEIDPDTGTFEVRAVLDNAGAFDEVILPGTFVQVRTTIDEEQNALLVNERAIGSDQSGSYLLVVNSEDVVEQRTIELGPLLGEMRVIDNGIRRDDWVIVNGLQRARPGGKVAPERSDPGGPTATGTSAAKPAATDDAAPAKDAG